MISERRLKKWRREALKEIQRETSLGLRELITIKAELSKRILEMTRELLDTHLLKK